MQYLIIISFFYLGFLSQPFTIPPASTSTTTTSAPHYHFYLITFHRNQSIDLLYTSIDWFLYDREFRHERVNVRFTADFAIFGI